MIKTVYAPSPVGYSLPASNAFTGFTTTGQNTWNSAEWNVKGNFDNGWYFYTAPNKKGILMFILAAGERVDKGGLNVFFAHGGYWSGSPHSSSGGRHLLFSSLYVAVIYGSLNSYGFAVRSAEERETHKFNIKREMDGQYYNLWSTDNQRTDNNDEVVIKSVYDPSPVGYSLPASNAFTGFNTIGGNVGWENKQPTPEQRAKFNVKGNFDKGWYFYTKINRQGITHFFSANGGRDFISGKMYRVDEHGVYWLSGGNGEFFYFGIGCVYTIVKESRSYGFAVRSAEEKCVGMVKIPY